MIDSYIAHFIFIQILAYLFKNQHFVKHMMEEQ